jgi:ABC-type lipoprotein export system ATPase subunit
VIQDLAKKRGVTVVLVTHDARILDVEDRTCPSRTGASRRL